MKLTPRQRAVLELLCQGLYDREIAAKLGIGVHGVRRHVENLFRKFNQSSRIGLAVAFVRAGGGNSATGNLAIFQSSKKPARLRT